MVEDLGPQRLLSRHPLALVRDLHDAVKLGGGKRRHLGVDVVRVILEDREGVGRLADLLRQFCLSVTEHLDERLGGLQATGHDILGRRGLAGPDLLPSRIGTAGLDHHDRDVTVRQHPAGDHHREDGGRLLFDGRETDPLVAQQGHPDPTDGAVERQPGDLGRHGRGVDRNHVVLDLGVQRQHGHHDLYLVAQALHEGRAQRAVDQPASQDGVLTGAALPAEERARDPPDRVHLLFDIDGQWEEVDGLAWGLLCGGGRQQHGVAVQVDSSRAIGLLCQHSGFEADDMLAVSAVVDDCLGELEVFTLHLIVLSACGRVSAAPGTEPFRPEPDAGGPFGFRLGLPVFDRDHRDAGVIARPAR